ncbi:hypothetical protein [Prochlorococcus sp. MIT 1341]|uniref:hypothetical protein n=1 Tax=Prochlorococcus sp. MIT 1341 TaxID=3096221 RepID=UPI002A75A327|nr:hypothetical protein [Prochlorococcus sp. MIT 1341]
MEHQIKASQDKHMALALWKKGGSKRSLWCSLSKEDYLGIVDLSIVETINKIPVSAISLIKRSYLHKGRKVIIYAMHRMIAYKDSQNLLFKVLASICCNKKDTFIATTANKEGTSIYKMIGFIEGEPNVYLHTYILNPIYLPILLVFSSWTKIHRILLQITKTWIPKLYKKNYSDRIRKNLQNHIHLRSICNLSEDYDTKIDWNCTTLLKYLDSLIRVFRLDLYRFSNDSGKIFSILITTRFNHIWRSCSIADTTCNSIEFLKALEKAKNYLIFSCLRNAALRLYVRSSTSTPPLKNGSFIHVKKQVSSTLILNGKGYFVKISDQDKLSSLHGDSFL